MKFLPFLLALAVASTSVLAQSMPPGHPPTGAAKDGKAAPEVQLSQKAKVLSTMDAGGYTYIEVTQNKKTAWLAGPKTVVKKDDVVRFDEGMVMTDFTSPTLKRTFAKITFVGRLVVTNEKE